MPRSVVDIVTFELGATHQKKNVHMPTPLHVFGFEVVYPAGILPDYMHIVHLALGVDGLASVLMDLVDHPDGLVEGQSRDQKLEKLFENYKEWAEATRS